MQEPMEADTKRYGDVAKPSQQADEALFLTVKEWILADIRHSNDWRKRATEEFDFVAGKQWPEAARAALEQQNKPETTFNKTNKFIRAICGIEVNNRQQTIYLPRDIHEPGEVKGNETLTALSDWMDDTCNAKRQQSRAFRDLSICGMGWCESAMSFDEDPEGLYDEARLNPLECGWDKNAREQNISDSKRRWHIRKMTLSEARALIPGVTDAEDVTDSDLNASWAAEVHETKQSGAGPKTREQKELREDNMAPDDPRREVYIVRVQWWEYEPYVKTVDPQSGQLTDMPVKEYRALKKQVKETAGVDLPGATMRRKVFKQAFVGDKVLQVGECPRPDGFTLQCMTGEPDDNEGTWYGLVRLLKDPQTWNNKFFSQLLHMINTTAKGGIIAEADAVDDAREFLASYAKADHVSIVRSGAIKGGKIMAKPGTAITGGIMQLLELADKAYTDVTGINLELLGLAAREQAGVLEAPRKQAAMTILATMFDSLTMFRQEIGRIRLHFIQTHIRDGRIIRIQGEEGYKAIPFLKQQSIGRYDVIVDDAPTTTNTKEKAWAGLSMILPAFSHMLTPQVAAVIVDYVPYLPSKLVEGLKAIALKPDPMAQQQAQIGMRQASADAAKTEAEVAGTRADAILTMAKAGAEQAKAQATRWETLLGTLGLGPKAPQTQQEGDVIGPTPGGPSPVPELGSQPIAPEEAAPQMPVPNGGDMAAVVPPAGLNGGQM